MIKSGHEIESSLVLARLLSTKKKKTRDNFHKLKNSVLELENHQFLRQAVFLKQATLVTMVQVDNYRASIVPVVQYRTQFKK